MTSYAVKEYYSLSRSIRALGMGGAFYALSDDESALFYNPAGLSLYPGSGQLMLVNVNGQLSQGGLGAISTLQKAASGTNDVSKIVDDILSLQGQIIHLNAGYFPYYLARGFGLGILVADVKANVAFLGKEFDSNLDVTAISDSGLLLGYATHLSKFLHAGLNLKFLLRAGGTRIFTVLDFVRGAAVDVGGLGGIGIGADVDLGFVYELPKPPLGISNRLSLSFNNLVASNFPWSRVGGAPPQLPRMASFGIASIFKGGKWVDNFIVLLDLAEFSLGGQTSSDLGARTGSIYKHINLGVELPIRGWLFVRGGFHQGLYTIGLGVNAGFFRLDFATYGEEVASGVGRLSSRRYALRLALGYAGLPTRDAYQKRR